MLHDDRRDRLLRLPVLQEWDAVPQFANDTACAAFWETHLMGRALFDGLGSFDHDEDAPDLRKDDESFWAYRANLLEAPALAVRTAVIMCLVRDPPKINAISKALANRLGQVFGFADGDAFLAAVPPGYDPADTGDDAPFED